MWGHRCLHGGITVGRTDLCHRLAVAHVETGGVGAKPDGRTVLRAAANFENLRPSVEHASWPKREGDDELVERRQVADVTAGDGPDTYTAVYIEWRRG